MTHASQTTEESVDLFEDIESLPEDIQALCFEMSDACENGDPYLVLKDYLARFEALGYSFDYDLSGTAFDLHKITSEATGA